MNKTIVANWKMSPATLQEAQELFKFTMEQTSRLGEKNLNVIVCPPFVFIEELAKMLNQKHGGGGISLGAQDIFWEAKGAYTGEVSTTMLKNFNITHVLIGHSDRRYVLNESDEVINKKLKATLKADIKPVLLVGEREMGDTKEDILVNQVSRGLDGLTRDQISQIMFAYEPVWAISTNPGAKADTPENASQTIKLINSILVKNYKLKSQPFLYGGSVNEQNISAFLNQPEINGAVIGGASLRKEGFGRMLELVSAIK